MIPNREKNVPKIKKIGKIVETEDAGFFLLTHSGVGSHHHSDLHLRLWCQHLEPGMLLRAIRDQKRLSPFRCLSQTQRPDGNSL